VPTSSTTYRGKWKCGETTVIRVPKKLVNKVLNYAQELDGISDGLLLSEPRGEYFTASDISQDSPVNVSSIPQRSPFRYPGGKTWFVPYVRSWLHSREIKSSLLIEPFAGGGIVSLTAGFEHLAEHIVMSELDPNVAAVWRAVFGGQADWLCQKIESFKMTKRNVTSILSGSSLTQRDLAFATIIRNRVQRGGIMAAGAGLVKEGEDGKGLHSRWYPKTLSNRIREIALNRSKFTFIEGDGFDVIRRYADDENATFFVDPPYTAAARRLYSHWELDHSKLFTELSKVKGDFLLTYDNTREIRLLAEEHGFQSETVSMKNTHHAKMTELIIGRNLSWLKEAAITRETQAQITLQL
jgi:DNA adenine methylase